MATPRAGSWIARARAGAWGTRPRVWALSGALTLLAAGIAGFALPVKAPVAAPVAAPFLLLGLAFAAAEVGVVHVPLRRGAHSYSVSEIVLVVGLFTADPPSLILAQLVGSALALRLHRRQTGTKLAFNLAQFLLGTTVALALFSALVRGGDPTGPHGWVAALAAVAASTLLSDLAIFAAESLSERSWEPGRLPGMVGPSLLAAGGNTCIALVGVRALWRDPVAVLLLAPPVIMVLCAYRVYFSSQERYRNLEVLYDAARLLAGSGDTEDTVLTLLEQLRRAFRAEVAELRLFSGDGRQELVSVLRPGAPAAVMQPAAADDGAALACDRGVVVWRARAGAEGSLARELATRGHKDAMVAPLRGEHRQLGTLLVADRLGDISTFGAKDARLFELLAQQIETTLENDSLERSLVQLRALKEELHRQALHDGLTRLPNRRMFAERVQQAARRPGGRVAVAFIDLDDFKVVNDTLGHHAGDQLLVAVAERLLRCLRPTDVAARFGGDEFAVLLEDPGSDAEVADLGRRLLAALSGPFSLLGERVHVSASIGLAIGECGSPEIGHLSRHADLAMYRAKRAGKQRYALYSPELDARSLRPLAATDSREITPESGAA